MVEQCQQVKLVWGKELSIDSTQVNANAGLDSLMPRKAREARAAMQAHLAALFAEEDSQQEPQTAATEVGVAPREVTSPEVVTCTVPISLPVVLSEAEQEELASENAARHDWIAQEGRKPREVHGYDLRTADFKVSTTDPDATPMRLKGDSMSVGWLPGGKPRAGSALKKPAPISPNP